MDVMEKEEEAKVATPASTTRLRSSPARTRQRRRRRRRRRQLKRLNKTRKLSEFLRVIKT
jgi:hypothetical protein